MIHVKKNLIIFEDVQVWEDIKNKLVDYHGPSILISWKMRRELGFSVRYHKGLRPSDPSGGITDLRGRFYYADEIHLDFFDEPSLSWFVLKYINTSNTPL